MQELIANFIDVQKHYAIELGQKLKVSKLICTSGRFYMESLQDLSLLW